jgi:hypothetical protein
MKIYLKTFLLLFFLCAAFPLVAQEGDDESSESEAVKTTAAKLSLCDRNGARDKLKKALIPYRYNSMIVTNIGFRRYNQVKEISVPLFYDSKYRLVFNTEGLPQDLKVEIYDAPLTSKKRTKLYEAMSTEKQFVYEPGDDVKTGVVFVNYIVPAFTGEPGDVSVGCVVVMVGFENVGGFDTPAASESKK